MNSNQTDIFVGKIINERFKILSKLGQGGMGLVYLAEDQKENRKVVVKVLRDNNSNNHQWNLNHFRDEAKAIAKITHPSVVKFIDAGELEDGDPYFVMEYIKGTSLDKEIDPNTGLAGGLKRISNIIRQLGDAIQATHAKGIYHRDLKPQNIMIEKDSSNSGYDGERVKVIDFGIATVKESHEDRTKTTSSVGTPFYMSPEQIEGKPSKATDVYAIGVIAYQLVTGRVPFMPEEKGNIFQILTMQREGVKVRPRALRPSISQQADDLIVKALSYESRNRPQHVGSFTKELATALEPKEVTPPVRNSERLILVIASVLIMLLAGFIVITKLKDREYKEVRGLSYWAEVQRYKDGKLSQDVTKLTGGVTGETYFNTGDGIKFVFTSPQSGYLYLINEAAESKDNAQVYYLLFPSPNEKGDVLSKVAENQQTKTEQLQFNLESGTEKIWVIWSSKNIEEIENAVKTYSNQTDKGQVKDQEDIKFLSKLLNQKSDIKLESDAEAQKITINTKDKLLIYPIKLKHY